MERIMADHQRTFRSRARQLKREAQTFSWASYVLLVVGIATAIFAGVLVRAFEVPDPSAALKLRDTIRADYRQFAQTVEKTYRSITGKSDGTDQFLDELVKERMLIDELSLERAPIYNFGDSFVPRVLEQLQEGCKTDPKLCKAMNDLEALSRSTAIAELKQKKAKLAELLTASPDKLELSANILTNLGRLMALAFVSAIVGLLVTQYRYNLRLAAYYDARADALAMLNMEDEDAFQNLGKVRLLERLTTLLTPTAYNFGKAPPVASVEQVLSAAKEMREGASPSAATP
jgi:hypothetical protein